MRNEIAKIVAEFEKRKQNIFTDEIRLSNTFTQLHFDEQLPPGQQNLKNAILEFNDKLNQLKTWRDLSTLPSTNEIRLDLNNSLEQINALVDSINWC